MGEAYPCWRAAPRCRPPRGRKSRPPRGPKSRPRPKGPCNAKNIPKAVASWRWWNYLHAQVPCSKTPLRINIDETSVCLSQGKGKGSVFVRKSAQMVRHSKRRMYLTHVACVCDQPHLQRRLPQFIVGNERALPARAMAGLRAAAPSYVRIWRRRSSCLNQRQFAIMLGLIMAALRPYLDEYQVIFMLDAAKIHCTSLIFSECARLGVWPLLVPARLTWLMQVLDTHIFSVYKRSMEGSYQDALASGSIDIGRLLGCVYAAIEEAIQGKCWASAFDGNGYGASQCALRAKARGHLEFDGDVVVSSERPLEEDVRPCFPQGWVVPRAVFLRMAMPPPPAPPSHAVAACLPLPVAGRAITRSMARAADVVAAPAAAPPAVVVATRLIPRRYISPA